MVDAPPKAPRWVKIFVIVACVVLAVVIVVLLTSGGEHGPSRHLRGEALPASLAPTQIR